MRLSPGLHLTYCTNVHPAETAQGVLAALAGPVAAVKRRVCPDQPFGVGLRLSDAAARGDVGVLRAALDAQGMYAFSVNGFVHGGFQVDGLKQEVYAPGWDASERVAYTLRCAEVLAALLPDGVDGSLSTSAGTYRPWGHDAGVLRACAQGYVQAVQGLRELRDRTGRTVRLAVEPEPWTSLQTTSDAADFWAEHVRPAARGRVCDADLTALLGLCYDACHLAVMFEDPAHSVRTLQDGGVPIHKVQVTNALEVRPDRVGAVAALKAFDEPRFLHQTVARRPDGGLLEARDLPEVPADDPQGWGACEAWRSHFHVPVYAEELGDSGLVATTRPFLEGALRALLSADACDHYEVETYTWDVTPKSVRDDLVGMLADELVWTRQRLERT